LDTLRREQIKEHYRHFPNPVALLNKQLECIYCNKPLIIPDGTPLKPHMQTDLDIPVTGIINVIVILNGVSYCGRFEQFEDDLIKCELFDSEILQAMAEQTDFFGKCEKFLFSTEQGISQLRSLTNTFRDAVDNKAKDYSGLCRQYSAVISCLGSAVDNVFEYNNMLSKAPVPQPIDIVAMVNDIVERCNVILTKCGRCIDYVCDLEKMYINADKRYAFNALVNLIHNALVYSPRDCVPIVLLTLYDTDGLNYAYLKVTNETTLYGDKLNDSFNSGFYRLGFGRKIIQRFTEQAGGRYVEDISENWATIGVLIPEYDAFEDGEYIFENGVFSSYNTGIPDLLDTKMQEVVELFGVIT